MKISLAIRLFIIVFVFYVCASTKAPKVLVRPAWQMATARMTLDEVQSLKPVLYFQSFKDGKPYHQVDAYVVEYLTTGGGAGIPFLWKAYDVPVIKAEIAVTPAYVRVKAVYKNGKSSKWSKLFMID